MNEADNFYNKVAINCPQCVWHGCATSRLDKRYYTTVYHIPIDKFYFKKKQKKNLKIQNANWLLTQRLKELTFIFQNGSKYINMFRPFIARLFSPFCSLLMLWNVSCDWLRAIMWVIHRGLGLQILQGTMVCRLESSAARKLQKSIVQPGSNKESAPMYALSSRR